MRNNKSYPYNHFKEIKLSISSRPREKAMILKSQICQLKIKYNPYRVSPILVLF